MARPKKITKVRIERGKLGKRKANPARKKKSVRKKTAPKKKIARKKTAPRKKIIRKKTAPKKKTARKTKQQNIGVIVKRVPPFVDQTKINLLRNETRTLLSRSGWSKYIEERLARECRMLLAKLKETCPQLNLEVPLKAGEVLGEIALSSRQFQSVFSISSGSKEKPKVVWSDGSNELLVDLAGTSIRTTKDLVVVNIKVSCEETGNVIIQVPFATGSAANPTGLVFATDTIPQGPPEIVDIWGESLIALAWKSFTQAIVALADAAGTDKDGAGLVPASLAADRTGVKLLVMARHEMDRITQ